MAKLTTKVRNKLPANIFGLPEERAFPMPDASHAQNALARTSQGINAGTLTPAQAATIRRKAKGILGS